MVIFFECSRFSENPNRNKIVTGKYRRQGNWIIPIIFPSISQGNRVVDASNSVSPNNKHSVLKELFDCFFSEYLKNKYIKTIPIP